MVTPRITVLMPVYNAGRFLREAIDSILNQSFRPFELLIIDDASSDNSVSIVESYNDPRIRLYRNAKNLGVAPALNKGIGLASCELIARMDADGISHPQRLQKQFGYMKRNPECALLSTWARIVCDDKNMIRLERHRSNFYYYNLTFECCMHHPTIMFRKSAVEAVGLYNMPHSEGHDLFWKISTKFKIGNLPEPLVDCRAWSTRSNKFLEKPEYPIANEQIVLRNIRYYLGEDFQLSHLALACIRHNFKPVLQQYSPQTINEALTVIDAVTDKILQTENVNRDIRSIRSARHLKKKLILKELGRSLPVLQSIELLLRTRAWITLITLMKNFLQWQLKQQLKSLLNPHRGRKLKTATPQGIKNS
jgi:glycosyltransferase involved in cell wall biosynthesis